MAKLFFTYGTMGAGKSLRLLASAYNFEKNKIPFVVLKSEIDTRDGVDVVKSRPGMERECVSVAKDTNIRKLVGSLMNVGYAYGYSKLKWILVDEAQFLTSNQVDQLASIVDELGVNVMCYGLRTDFQTKLFEGSKRLFEIADSIEEIKSSCKCGDKTIFNARVGEDGHIIKDGSQIQVGGDEAYVSMCRKCYFRQTENPLYKNNEENIL